MSELRPRPPQTVGRTHSDGEGDEPGAGARRSESHMYESMRNSCGQRTGPHSGNRSRTTSDAQWQRSQDQDIISQPSSGNPSVNAYLTMGKRVEGFYREFGYLPAIVPPNDLERRQALRRYGPPKISSDVNFERVAHLVKLVFNTKLVIVSLVGEKTQHFRTQAGASSSGFSPEWLQSIAMSRNCSFCSHAILQDNDEPFVVLDTLKDWRFAGNPLVANSPHIRFYAGAPLRTTDGFNLGSLCIIDDKPWPEFNPRQRHTLREFARVVMREMELARDAVSLLALCAAACAADSPASQIHLKSRDRMQHSIELFTRECLEMESGDASADEDEAGLHQVYAFAAKGMREALQASGAIVFDLSHFELVESPSFDGEETTSKIFFPSPYQNPDAAPFASFDNPGGIEGLMETTGGMSQEAGAELKNKAVPPMAVLGASESHAAPPDRGQPVPLSHYIKVAEFLRRHRTGCYYPFVPAPFRHLLPPDASNLLLVPIFGLNKQPFALLCAYSKSSENGPQLQDIKDSGLQYLRAMGTIILSAILKKDIMLADKAKSHFISNISHELRTPLHGILAAAELLAETKINATQGSYLETVEACGKSLLELVNHVLDFTKLSGNTRTSQMATKPTQRCDLVKLVQEVCESSWIGQMARKLDSQQSSGIGSAYAQGSSGSAEPGAASVRPSIGRALGGGAVETVIDVMMRPDGWLVKCDAAGIRRVLMNLIGNSLKFTTEGFVHVSLRELQSSDTHVVVELGVTDTGKGISRAFLEEQLFHPFTQENHLGPGTGLGLSIVNSIVQSPAINGKIDVWSTLGQGTEMRVTCELELADANAADLEGLVYRPQLNVAQQHTVSLLGFDPESRGHSDLKEVLRSYLEDWWHCTVVDADADFVVINEALPLLEDLAKTARDAQRSPPPALVLTGARGDPQGTAACDNYHRAGGVSRLLFKPVGPAKLESLVDFCVRCVERIKRGEPALAADEDRDAPLPSPAASPMKPALEKADSYFSTTSSSSARTPRVEVRLDSALTPKASDSSRVTVPSLHHAALSSHHMSPGPPSLSDAGSLLRRHSDHDRNATIRTHSDSSIDSAPPTSRRSRPTLPARSITFHEPRLQRQAVMSPNHSSHPHSGSSRRSDSGEVHDYFGPAAMAATASTSGSSTASMHSASTPNSPGSTISLEGGDGAILRSALQTPRGSHGSHSSIKRRLHILSIDDNQINRKMLAAFLSKMDVEYVEAANGEEGVRAFEAHPPQYFDVILMDISMPVLDGISATAQIRKMEAERFRAAVQHGGAQAPSSWRGAHPRAPGVGTPGGSRPTAQSRAKIFALTGHSSDDDKRRAFATGADGFIVKPLSFKM
jgi:signal transduction histidine kinase/CheY-like chemotaxis protein